jgi:ribosome-associated heat shock protein Hsp15
MCKDESVDSTRVDRWLWSVRLYKTRADATTGCRGGHVRLNGRVAKPATQVRVGDRVEARVHQRDRVIEVTKIIDTRVGASIAAECYIDHSPPPTVEYPRVAARERGSGRPTKRERRQLDRWRGRTR